MDTDGSAADLHTVAYHVVGIGKHAGRVGVEFLDVRRFRRGERMVHGHQTAFFLAPFEHGEVNHPKQCKLVLVAQTEAFAHEQT